MPLQSDCLLALLPRALLWARSCRPFRPFFGYMRIIIIFNFQFSIFNLQIPYFLVPVKVVSIDIGMLPYFKENVTTIVLSFINKVTLLTV